MNKYRSHVTNLSSEPISQPTYQSEYDEKLERCCQNLEQLISKVDRLLNLEQTGILLIRMNLKNRTLIKYIKALVVDLIRVNILIT